MFSFALAKLRNDGTIDALKSKWWNDGGLCASTTSTTTYQPFEAVRLVDLSGVFLVLAGSAVAGIVVLGIELYVHRYRHQEAGFFHRLNRDVCGYDSENDVADLEELGVTVDDLDKVSSRLGSLPHLALCRPLEDSSYLFLIQPPLHSSLVPFSDRLPPLSTSFAGPGGRVPQQPLDARPPRRG